MQSMMKKLKNSDFSHSNMSKSHVEFFLKNKE